MVHRDTSTEEQQSTSVDVLPGADVPWSTVVWNDPVNLTSYVSYVFRRHFGYSRDKAQTLMWQVHNEGRAIVASGPREVMEHHVQAMHEYGLWATIEKVPK